MSYYTQDGTAVTQSQIEQAVAEKRAVLCWSHGEWKNVAGLLIFADPAEAELEAERDTRGECHSMADEVWCELASAAEALRAAKGLLSFS